MPSKKKAPAKKPATKAKAVAKAAPKRVGKGRTGAKPATPAKAPAKPKAAAKPSPAAKPKAKPAQGPARDLSNREIIPDDTPRFNVRSLICEMIGEQKHTDQEILAAVAKALPEKTINLNIIGACRSEMNHGLRFPSNAVAREPHTPPAVPYEQVLKVDGVNMRRSERPPKAGKPRKPARGKVNAENDPLAKLGIPAAKRRPARKESVAA